MALHPVMLRPEQADEVANALATHGYVVLVDAYTPDDVAEINAFCDATQQSQPEKVRFRRQVGPEVGPTPAF